MLTALWVFKAKDVPTNEQILLGQANSRALAIYDVNSLIENPLRLYLPETNLDPGQKEQVLVGFYRGKQTDTPVSVAVRKQEQVWSCR